MAGLDDFRKQHPEYNDIGDIDLADKLHAKFYSDIPKDQYFSKLGIKAPMVPASKDGEIGQPGQNHKDLPGGQPEDRGSTGGFADASGNYMDRRDAGAAARANGLDTPSKLTTEELNKSRGLPEKSENQPKPNIAGSSMDLGPAPPNRPKDDQSSRTGEQLRNVWDKPLGIGVDKMDKYVPEPIAAATSGASAIVDVLSRVPDTAKALLSAGPADIAEKFGVDSTTADKIHRELGALFDVSTTVLGGEVPSTTPKMTVKSDLSLTDRAINAVQKPVGAYIDRDPEAAARARALADKGMRVSPSAYASLPRSQFFLEQSRKFDYDPTAASSAEIAKEGLIAAMRKGGASEAEIENAQNQLSKTADYSLEKSGEAVRDRLDTERSQGEIKLNRTADKIANDAEVAGNAKAAAAVAEHEKTVNALTRAQAKSAGAAQKMIDKGMTSLDRIRRAAAPGALGETMSNAITGLRNATTDAATVLYDKATRLAGDVKITTNTREVTDAVDNFRRDIPADVIKQSPVLERLIAKLGQADEEVGTGVLDASGKEMTREAESGMAFGELHQLRSELRDLGYNASLTPSMKKGAYKYFSGVVDRMIAEGSNSLSTPKLKAAGQALKEADDFYAKNMAKFRDAGLQKLADNMKSKLPPNPEEVARQIANSDNRNLRRQILDLAGPQTRRKIASADMDGILTEIRSQATGEINSRDFLSQIEQRAKSGVLADYYGETQASTILALARRLAQRGGTVPLDVGQQDNFVRALRAANQKADELAKLVKPDPIGILEKERAAAQTRIGQLRDVKKTSETAEFDPLQAAMSGTGHAAAERIIRSPTLISSAIARFGAEDPAIKLLQRQALERLLTPIARGEKGSSLTAGLLDIPEESQKLLFPDGLHDDLRVLAKDIDFVSGRSTRSAAGMAAASSFSRDLPEFIKKQLITKTFAWAITHPTVTKFLAGEVKTGKLTVSAARNKLLDAYTAGSMAQGVPPDALDQQAPEDQGDNWWEK